MIRTEHRILVLSLAMGLGLWVMDAAVDSLFFSRGSFVDQLLLDISGHEIFFRSFYIAIFLVFGVIASRLLVRRRQAEELLHQAVAAATAEKAKSEAIITALGDGVSIQDRDFRVLYQNEAHKQIAGDQAGKLCYAAYARKDNVCEGCPVARSFEDGRVHTLEKSLNKEGSTLHFEIKASPLRDSGGNIIAGIELVRDISVRKHSEEALAESEKWYRALFEGAADAIFLIEAEGDQVGRIVAANRAAAEMHGYSVEDILRMRITDLDSPEAAREAPGRIAQILAGEWINAEISHCRKDGTVFPVEITAGLLELGGRKYVLAFDRDITRRKAAEEEREVLIRELRSAIEKIKTLRGLLPICAWCKKIRDDRGYWQQVEDYISEHSGALFTHGICPDCLRREDPDVFRNISGDPA